MANIRLHYIQPGSTSANVTPLPSPPTSHTETTTVTHTRGCVQEIGDQIARSQAGHPNLKQQPNAPAYSQASHLPFELISHIFDYVCEPPSPGPGQSRLIRPPWCAPHNAKMTPWARYSPVVLGLVCSYWREIVRSRPDLWTTIRLEIRPRSSHTHGSILGLYLENSGTLPLSISMRLSLGLNRGWAGLDSPVFDLLFQYRDRITKLHLVEPPISWAGLVSRLPQLEELYLNPEVGNQASLLEHAWQMSISSDRIRCISLHLQDRGPGLWLQNVTLSPLTNYLTSVDLLSVSIDICADLLLRQCPALVEYRCASPDSSVSPELPWLTKQTTLPHLEFFDWSCTRYRWATAIIRYIHLPSLKTVRWDEGVSRMSREPKETFFRRHLHMIKHIEFDYLPFLSDSPMGCLPNDMGVEHLVLSRCSETVLEDVYTKLTPNPGAQPNMIRFPNLSSVTIGAMWVRDEIVAKVKSAETHKLETLFVKMMEARHAAGSCAGFRLIDNLAKLKWPSHLQERLSKLNPAPVIFSGSEESGL